MESKKFSIQIDAPKEKVWKLLWDDATYPVWTAPFSENSVAVSDWKEGSKIFFMCKNEGMASKIAKKIEPTYMSFLHLGMVKDGVEDYDSPEVKAYQGAEENYTLTDENNATRLDIDIDVADMHKEYFDQTWPQALQLIKKISEE